MITLATLLSRVRGVDAATVEVWIEQEWVRPGRREGAPVFEEVDVARVGLIVELRDAMAIDEGAIPVVLSLLDQLHSTRAQLARICEVLAEEGDRPVREVVTLLSRG